VTLADELLHDLSRALQPENVRVVYG
jgi:hypothetical protein